MQLEIKQKIDSMGRFREASLERHFTEEQKDYIRTFPGLSFKEQMFRSAGMGKCLGCDSDSEYVEKMRFRAYHSRECELNAIKKRTQTDRNEKLLELHALLKQYDITLIDPENYVNALTALNFKCDKCGKTFKTQHDRALRHACNHTYGPAPKFKAPKVKKERVKKIKTNDKKCIVCLCERHPKSKPGMCEKCRKNDNRAKSIEKHLYQLKEMGYTTTEKELWDNHGKITVTNTDCNHTFTSTLGNILSGLSVCGVCGPSKRRESMMQGYMRKYARDYNLSESIDYSKYVRGLSDKNWLIANQECSNRGHTGMHLDHKVPIIFGFKNNIPPEAIADIDNLELLPYAENISKGGKMFRWDILDILKAKYDFSAYSPKIVKSMSAKTEKLLSYIALEPTLVNEDSIVYGDTALYVVHFNSQISMGNLIKPDDKDYLIVFEDELAGNRRRIIESMINYGLGNSRKIYARKCEIREVSSVQSDRFMWTNHLSGDIKSSYRIGLFFNDELVAVMLFCKSRFSRDHEWELLRFANKLDTAVAGGASKLYSHFIKNVNPTSVMTYADKRFGNNKSVYENIGMQYVKSTVPSSWWVKDGTRINSQDVRFEKLPKLLGQGFNQLVGIDTNMINNGWVKLEDLGSNVYEWFKS